jgi:DUF1707 SHOCT-like domain
MNEMQPIGPGQKRASDADRDRVIGVLSDALAHGMLTPEEHEERLTAVYQAKTVVELASLTQDLADIPDDEPALLRTTAVFSKIHRAGQLTVSKRYDARAVFGAAYINLADARFSGREVTIDATSVFGKIVIVVPAGAKVFDEGNAIFGKRALPSGGPGSGEAGPTIRITGKSVFGKLRVGRAGDSRWAAFARQLGRPKG